MSVNQPILRDQSGSDAATIDILFVGAALAATKQAFGKNASVRCEHASSSTDAIDVMSSRNRESGFDCVMVDMRHREDGSALNVVALAALQTSSMIVVLCQPEQIDTFRNLTGVDKVIPAPVEPKAILDVISEAAERSDEMNSGKSDPIVEVDTAADADETHASNPVTSTTVRSEVVAAETESLDKAINLEELARYSAEDARKHLSGLTGIAPVVDETISAEETDGSTVCDLLDTDALQHDKATSIDVQAEELPTEPEGAITAVEDPAEEASIKEPVSGDPDPLDPLHIKPEIKETGEDAPRTAAKPVTKGFETTLSKVQKADQQVWQRFVPLANFAYKKLAIIVLSALFLTFLAYGAMIVFFMSSSSWSLPFELSRGHILVEKTERDLSSLRLRRNQVQQEINTTEVEQKQAQRERRDGEKQLLLTQRTVEEELVLQRTQKLEIQQHISRLKKVIQDFNRINGRGGFAKSLDSAYARRLITKKSLNSGTLAVLETLHRIAVVNNEIAVKQIELQRTTRALEFLETLLSEIKQPELRVITSAGSNLSYLARDSIEAKNRIALAVRTENSLTNRLERLENSLGVLSENLASLAETPAARALKKPVMVLFVPYTNSDNVSSGKPLYSCALSIFFCSNVGEIGDPVRGETTAVHPLFGKPMRGTFIEANFRNPKSVTAEIVHAGRRPLFF